MPARNSPPLGKWRIVERELRDADVLDKLDQTGALTGEIRFHLGDESTFKAHRCVSFSAAC